MFAARQRLCLAHSSSLRERPLPRPGRSISPLKIAPCRSLSQQTRPAYWRLSAVSCPPLLSSSASAPAAACLTALNSRSQTFLRCVRRATAVNPYPSWTYITVPWIPRGYTPHPTPNSFPLFPHPCPSSPVSPLYLLWNPHLQKNQGGR